MMKKMIVASLFLMTFTGLLMAQNCIDPLRSYLSQNKKEEGFHGGLNFVLGGEGFTGQGNHFITVWKDINLNASTPADFFLHATREHGRSLILEYHLMYQDIPVDGALLKLEFDKTKNRLVAYYDQGTSKLDEFHASEAAQLLFSPVPHPALLTQFYRGSIIEQTNYLLYERGVFTPCQEIVMGLADQTRILKYDLVKEQLISDERKDNLSRNANPVTTNTTLGGDCYSGNIYVTEQANSCMRVEMPIVQDDLDFCIIASGAFYRLVHNFDFGSEFVVSSAGLFNFSSEQMNENNDCDDVNNASYEAIMSLYHLVKLYNELDMEEVEFINLKFWVNQELGALPYIINYQGADELAFGFGARDIAEDVTYIISAGLHYYLNKRYNGASPDDGLLEGTLDFLSYKKRGFTNFFEWSGNLGKQRTLEVGAGFSYPGEDNVERIESWGSALYEMDQQMDDGGDIEYLVDYLFSTYFQEGGVDQPTAANMLLLKADLEDDRFSDEEVCSIATILSRKYPYAVLDYTADLYIQDSPEDTGEEPNGDSEWFWTSEAIWNCNSAGCAEQQEPEYEAGQTRYMYVRVENKCDGFGVDDFPGKKIAVYGSLASNRRDFPQDFQGAYGKQLGATLDIADGVEQGDGSFLYEFPYTPFNPADFPNLVNENENLHMCVRAYIFEGDIVSTFEDPDNIRDYNDIAQRNMGIMSGENMPTGSDEEVSVFFVRPPVVYDYYTEEEISNMTYTIDLSFDFLEATLAQHHLSVNDIWIDLSGDVLQGWLNGGQTGADYEMVPDLMNPGHTRFYALSPNFVLNNIVLEPDSQHIIRIGVKRGATFTPFDFNLLTKDASKGCYLSGEHFSVRHRVPPGWNVNPMERPENNGPSIITRVQILPNPASTQIELNASTIMNRVDIFDLNGRLLFSEGEVYGQKIELDISTYERGAYFLKIHTESEEVLVRKFVKI